MKNVFLLFIGLQVGFRVFAQEATFLENDQIGGSLDLRMEKIVSKLNGEFVIIFNNVTSQRTRVHIGNYNNLGKLVSHFSPSIPFVNQSIYAASISDDKRIFFTGIGEDITVVNSPVQNFSYCFDVHGQKIWERIDSSTYSHCSSVNDSIDIAIENVHIGYSSFKAGQQFLVKLNHGGEVIWRYSLDPIYKKHGLDTTKVKTITKFATNSNGFWFQLSNNIPSVYGILHIDKGLIKTRFLEVSNLTNSDFHDNFNIISRYNGDKNYNKYEILLLDLNLNLEFKLVDTTPKFNRIPIYGPNLLGDLIGFTPTYYDSTWAWERKEFRIYKVGNKSIELIRTCQYTNKNYMHFTTVGAIPMGNGFLFDAYLNPTYPGNLFMKTDSLGLVYNTDVICDCKDYNTGIGEQEAATENVHVT
ncbi:MAG: hypothetical protein KDC83_15355, partial [Flavobacteriales bacterium]|nr:hypothetical protein [Flavobacteriales bacterium]